MNFHNRLLPVVTITGSSLVVGCGGNSGGSCGYGSSYGCAAPVNIYGDGYYEGSLTNQGAAQATPAVAIIADNGDGVISSQDGTYYRLNVSLPGNSITGTYLAISRQATFANGSQVTSGSVDASASPTGLNGAVADQTGAATGLALSFDPIYNLGSTLATLAGTWSYTANGFSLTATIQTNGTFSAVDSNNCAYSGAFAIIDPSFNAYQETYTRSCGGVQVTFTGLATYLPPVANTTNADIKSMADDNVSEFLVADFQ